MHEMPSAEGKFLKNTSGCTSDPPPWAEVQSATAPAAPLHSTLYSTALHSTPQLKCRLPG